MFSKLSVVSKIGFPNPPTVISLIHALGFNIKLL